LVNHLKKKLLDILVERASMTEEERKETEEEKRIEAEKN